MHSYSTLDRDFHSKHFLYILIKNTEIDKVEPLTYFSLLRAIFWYWHRFNKKKLQRKLTKFTIIFENPKKLRQLKMFTINKKNPAIPGKHH